MGWSVRFSGCHMIFSCCQKGLHNSSETTLRGARWFVFDEAFVDACDSYHIGFE